MELLRGITGIQGRKEGSPVAPFSDLNAFRSHCHVVARAVGAKIKNIEDPLEAANIRNFAIARFEFTDGTVAVLLNLVYPIVAFAKWPSEGQIVFEFIDCPRLAEGFGTFREYTLALSDELNRPLVLEMCNNLSSSELKCVRYFRPARAGDVIFNFWD